MTPLHEASTNKSGFFSWMVKGYPFSCWSLIINLILVSIFFYNRTWIISPAIFALLVPPVISIVATIVEPTKKPGFITLGINLMIPLLLVLILVWLSIALASL